MSSFQEGHTTNVGKTYHAAKVKRIIKRAARREREKQEKTQEILNSQALPEAILPMRDYSIQAAILKANRSVGRPFQKGHMKLPGGGIGRPKKTASIKDKIIKELAHKGNNDVIDITRRLINMAKAGDLKAIEMIMDRVDGKVPTTIGGDKDNPLKIVVEPVLAAKYSKNNADTIPNSNSPRHAQIQSN